MTFLKLLGVASTVPTPRAMKHAHFCQLCEKVAVVPAMAYLRAAGDPIGSQDFYLR